MFSARVDVWTWKQCFTKPIVLKCLQGWMQQMAQVLPLQINGLSKLMALLSNHSIKHWTLNILPFRGNFNEPSRITLLSRHFHIHGYKIIKLLSILMFWSYDLPNLIFTIVESTAGSTCHWPIDPALYPTHAKQAFSRANKLAEKNLSIGSVITRNARNAMCPGYFNRRWSFATSKPRTHKRVELSKQNVPTCHATATRHFVGNIN